MYFDTSTKIQILWCFFIDEVERVIRAAAVDDLEGFVAWDQNWVWWWVWYSKLCIFSGFRWLSSTLHAIVNFHHKVKFCNHCIRFQKYAMCSSMSPKTPHRMEGICPNVPLAELSKTQHVFFVHSLPEWHRSHTLRQSYWQYPPWPCPWTCHSPPRRHELWKEVYPWESKRSQESAKSPNPCAVP